MNAPDNKGVQPKPGRPTLLQTATLVYGALCVANTFFFWSFPAWFVLCFFGSCGLPSGLISPEVDKWLIEPLAMAVLYLQLPSWLVMFNVKPFSLIEPPFATLLASALSLIFYLPLTRWLVGRWAKHRAV